MNYTNVPSRGFPRTRGDEPGDLTAAWDKPMFSPHARG